MANDSKGTPRPFDVKTVEHLIGLMGQHELSEISLQEGNQRIRLRKASAPVITGTPMPMMAAPATVATPAAQSATTTSSAPAAPAKKLLEIKSEMVGTFYAKPKPDKPDYVSVGSKLKPDTIICQIEAMKIFNEMPAGISGTIAEVCVKNAEPVEFGTVLFRVDPS